MPLPTSQQEGSQAIQRKCRGWQGHSLCFQYLPINSLLLPPHLLLQAAVPVPRPPSSPSPITFHLALSALPSLPNPPSRDWQEPKPHRDEGRTSALPIGLEVVSRASHPTGRDLCSLHTEECTGPALLSLCSQARINSLESGRGHLKAGFTPLAASCQVPGPPGGCEPGGMGPINCRAERVIGFFSYSHSFPSCQDPSFWRIIQCGSQLPVFQRRNTTFLHLRVSVLDNILNPSHSDYKSNANHCTTFGN